MKKLRLECGSPQNLTKIMNSKSKKRLRIEELKSYSGFENYTDEIAEETIASP
ncbi:MAG: hypothetical protein SFY56_13850 [Bacteroidota bacterium]|nr:hypothetical protein [Bacteroidota bacterium]